MKIVAPLRVLTMAIAGFMVGYLATQLVDRIAWSPIASSVIIALALCIASVLMLKLELLSFLGLASIFTYASFVGMALVRQTNAKNMLDSYSWGKNTLSGSVEGLSLPALLVGMAFTLALVSIATNVWGLAQRIDSPSRDDRARAFLDFLDSSK